MQKRLEAMIDAATTVRPALEEFYNSLNDEQKPSSTASAARPPRAVRRNRNCPKFLATVRQVWSHSTRSAPGFTGS